MERRRPRSTTPPPLPSAAAEALAPPSFDWRLLAVFGGLLAAVLVAYHPAWHGGPIWDDDAHVTKASLRSLQGLWRIWFDLGATQQYYPLVHSTFWLQAKLWGDNPLGYHLLNAALHATSAFLLVLILRRLAVPGAIFAGVIFALHPVYVESVAWMTELKNTMSGVFYFAAALAYLRFDRTRRYGAYAAAVSLFVLALLSKTVSAMLPAGLLVVFWWQRGTLSWRRDLVPLLPFFALGLAGGLTTSWVERTYIGAQGSDFEFTFIERCLIAGRAVVFYLGKLVWPNNLIFLYPRWQVSQAVWWQYLYPLGVAMVLAGLWFLRRRTRAPLAALSFFGVTLAPALGFVNVYPFKFSFVADHFQYLASVGIIALAAAGLARLAARGGASAGRLQAGMIVAIGLPLGALTWQQSRQYSDVRTLYLETLRRNPTSWLAQNNLALLESHGSDEERQDSFARLLEAMRINPDEPLVRNNVGVALRERGRAQEAVEQHLTALRQAPGYAEAYGNLGADYSTLGRFGEAVTAYRQAIAIKPELVAVHFDLGMALDKLGRSDEAVIEMREALKVDPGNIEQRVALADALDHAGRPVDALAEYQDALRLDPSSSRAHSGLGRALMKAGRLGEAEGHLREAIRLDPKNAGDRDNLGNILQGTNRLDEAVEEYEAALSLDAGARRPEIHNDLGVAFARLGRRDAARAEFEAALTLDSNFAPARTNLARIQGQ